MKVMTNKSGSEIISHSEIVRRAIDQIVHIVTKESTHFRSWDDLMGGILHRINLDEITGHICSLPNLIDFVTTSPLPIAMERLSRFLNDRDYYGDACSAYESVFQIAMSAFIDELQIELLRRNITPEKFDTFLVWKRSESRPSGSLIDMFNRCVINDEPLEKFVAI